MKFANINEFLEYYEFCPFCKKSRMELNGETTPNSIVMSAIIDQTPTTYSININDNNIISALGLIDNKVYTVSKKCRKYHFALTINFTTDLINNTIKDIKLDNEFCVQYIDNLHFALISNYNANTSYIRITNEMGRAREIKLDLTQFDFNKKALHKKLSNINIIS